MADIERTRLSSPVRVRSLVPGVIRYDTHGGVSIQEKRPLTLTKHCNFYLEGANLSIGATRDGNGVEVNFLPYNHHCAKDLYWTGGTKKQFEQNKWKEQKRLRFDNPNLDGIHHTWGRFGIKERPFDTLRIGSNIEPSLEVEFLGHPERNGVVAKLLDKDSQDNSNIFQHLVPSRDGLGRWLIFASPILQTPSLKAVLAAEFGNGVGINPARDIFLTRLTAVTRFEVDKKIRIIHGQWQYLGWWMDRDEWIRKLAVMREFVKGFGNLKDADFSFLEDMVTGVGTDLKKGSNRWLKDLPQTELAKKNLGVCQVMEEIRDQLAPSLAGTRLFV